jgi:hypothetical protein
MLQEQPAEVTGAEANTIGKRLDIAAVERALGD